MTNSDVCRINMAVHDILYSKLYVYSMKVIRLLYVSESRGVLTINIIIIITDVSCRDPGPRGFD